MFKVGRQSGSLEFSRPVGISLTTSTDTSETKNESAFSVCAHDKVDYLLISITSNPKKKTREDKKIGVNLIYICVMNLYETLQYIVFFDTGKLSAFVWQLLQSDDHKHFTPHSVIHPFIDG